MKEVQTGSGLHLLIGFFSRELCLDLRGMDLRGMDLWGIGLRGRLSEE